MKFYLWVFLGLISLLPWISTPVALVAGVVFGLLLGNPRPEFTQRATKYLLQASVVGLGAGMDLRVVGRVGAHGVIYTVIGIAITLALGALIGRGLRCSRDVAVLISVGTAICGGSAIAAMAPVIRAKHGDITVALATVFLLNATALLVFPWIGHQLQLSEQAFGLWCALAIHDTSSVVGASMQFGREALQIGTTVKLARALWIVPLTLAAGVWTQSGQTKLKLPWFILGFLGVAAVFTFLPAFQLMGSVIEFIARRGLVLTLYLIGCGISKEGLKAVGLGPFLLGIFLWLIVGSASLYGIWSGWIRL